MNIERESIEQYLLEVKESVKKDKYRLDHNSRRQDNIKLFLDYVIDEAKVKEVILDLDTQDFSTILQNEHKGFEEKTVSLYIKFNKLENCFVIVISFHEQKYPLTYYFK